MGQPTEEDGEVLKDDVPERLRWSPGFDDVLPDREGLDEESVVHSVRDVHAPVPDDVAPVPVKPVGDLLSQVSVTRRSYTRGTDRGSTRDHRHNKTGTQQEMGPWGGKDPESSRFNT